MSDPRTYVLGDIHGNLRALEQVLERSPFREGRDVLVCLGDYVDGWPESHGVIERLIGLEGVVGLLGNHDQWALDWMGLGQASELWLDQGGRATVASYERAGGVRASHLRFLRRCRPYWQDEVGRVFVHAGLDPSVPLGRQRERTLLWDRHLARRALEAHHVERQNGRRASLTDFPAVFLGHTPVGEDGDPRPVRGGEVWLLDQGAGWDGRLTMMDVETKAYWQSDRAETLYPEAEGRR